MRNVVAETATAPGAVRRNIGGELLSVRGLVKHFPLSTDLFGRVKKVLRAVDGVDLDVRAGETLALVGESGSGKTTAGRCILRLVEPSAGSVRFMNEDFLALKREPLRKMRRHIQIIFQDPYSSLNPVRTVSSTLKEALSLYDSGLSLENAMRELLARVGLPATYATRKPVALSGGERQRVAIARALAVKPKIIVCDEPASALDVSVQAQILNLFKALRADLGMSYVFITHDLAVVRQVVERVYVLYRGEVVESGLVDEVLDNPTHEYTIKLVNSVPRSGAKWLRS